ncbi:branched-chain amino acid ABC transporter permease [archaeon SCG-AAA382B04]|nr:branched-chain amino acid ABC transporter permease [archaeon SCG-AAA382B04]
MILPSLVNYFIYIGIIIGIYGLFALGLNLEWGFTGILNFGHVAFMGIAAYTMAILNIAGLNLFISIIIGIALSIVAGVLIGAPTLKLRGDYLAIVTIAFSEIIRYFYINEGWLTGGAGGLSNFNQLLGFLPSQYKQIGFLIVTLALLGIVYVFLEKLINSPWGRVLKSIREDEEVSKALGKNIYKYKIQSLAIGSGIAGIAGILQAFNNYLVLPSSYKPLITFYAWIIVVLGGSANNKGSLVGAIIFVAFFESTRFLPLGDVRVGSLRMIIIGLLLILLMLFRPQGILGNKEELKLDI